MQILQLFPLLAERLGPQESVQEAARRLSLVRRPFLPVCDSAGRILGALGERELCRVVAEGLPPETTVASVMRAAVRSCRPDDPVERAVDLLLEEPSGALVCLDEAGHLLGLVTLAELLLAQAETELPRPAGEPPLWN
jgi:CBS-domain-containing membrane protein